MQINNVIMQYRRGGQTPGVLSLKSQDVQSGASVLTTAG